MVSSYLDPGQGPVCLGCMSVRRKTFIIAVSQLVLGVNLFLLHVYAVSELMKEEDFFGHFLMLSLPPDYKRSSLHSYHIVSAIMSCFMITLSIILLSGLFNYRTSFVWAWLLGSAMLCMPYFILLFYSFAMTILGYVIENFIVLILTAMFTVCGYPYYRWVAEMENEARQLLPQTSQ